MSPSWEPRAQVRSADLTGNNVPEVLVELTFFELGQFLEGALFAYRCAGREYVGGAVLEFGGQVLSLTNPDGIRAIRNLTENGVPEIVHSYISIAGSHSYFTREFRILELNGQAFVDS